MRLKGLFWIFAVLLLAIWAVISYYVLYTVSIGWFFAVESLIALSMIYLFLFYQRVIKPLHIIGNGMELLKEQDFSSRLGKVGQVEADRVVDVFNRMMEQLKSERLRLREQNHFLDLLINASPMGVVILNLDEEILSVNPAACKILEIRDPEKVVGKTVAGVDSPLAEELARIPMNQSSTIRLNNASVYKCTHSSFIDRGFQHTFYLIEVLTDEVFSAEKKAYEKVIRMIAHEVNNTTAGITSSLDTLESTLRDAEEMEYVRELLRVLIERCYSMSRFITRFADVVRIPEPRRQPCSLNEIVASCERFMENSCHDRAIDIVTELAPGEPVASLDSVLFEQVLVNILKNSAEAIGEGGTIYIHTYAEPNGIEIADTGKGIDKATEAKLFSPFFSTKPNGQGLGLIFIREVLLRHGCRFSLRTYPDGLTRFKIWFDSR